jgi:hypothetical protein
MAPAYILLTIFVLWLIYAFVAHGGERQEHSQLHQAERRPAGPRVARRTVPPALYERERRQQSDLAMSAPLSADDTPSPAVEPGSSPGTVVELEPWELPVIFRCSRCKASFASVEEVRAHRARHGGRSGEQRRPLQPAGHFAGRPFVVDSQRPAEVPEREAV